MLAKLVLSSSWVVGLFLDPKLCNFDFKEDQL